MLLVLFLEVVILFVVVSCGFGCFVFYCYFLNALSIDSVHVHVWHT